MLDGAFLRSQRLSNSIIGIFSAGRLVQWPISFPARKLLMAGPKSVIVDLCVDKLIEHVENLVVTHLQHARYIPLVFFLLRSRLLFFALSVSIENRVLCSRKFRLNPLFLTVHLQTDFENTTNPHIKYKWSEAEDPGEFKLLHPDYWKKQENHIAGPPKPRHTVDEIDELDEVISVLGRPMRQ